MLSKVLLACAVTIRWYHLFISGSEEFAFIQMESLCTSFTGLTADFICKLRCNPSFGLSKEFKLVHSLHLVLCDGGWYSLSLLLYWHRSASTKAPGTVEMWYFHGLFWAGWWLKICVGGQICLSCVPAITFLGNWSSWKAYFLLSHLPRAKAFSLCVIFWMSHLSQCLALS